jgi:hypothetical protein
MSMSREQDPLDRMHQAVLAAGVCINIPNAHFSEQWRVPLPGGAETYFADTTGKRLIMRGLIGQDRAEPSNGYAIRFVPVDPSVTKPPVVTKPNVVKFVRPKATKPADNALAARRAMTGLPREYKGWSHSVEHMTPWGIVNLGRPPFRSTILDRLEQIDLVLSEIVGRWQSVPAELRAEIMTKAYEPLLMILLQCKRRGQKTTPHRWSPRKVATLTAAKTKTGGATVTIKCRT